MSQRHTSIRKRVPAGGFTLVEVLVSIVILTVGLLGAAALISSALVTGTQARYMNVANVLASEKLDNLNKWPSFVDNNGNVSSDANIAIGGSLTGPSTCATGDTYCDQVTVSQITGANYETETQDVNGTPVTTTIVHTSSGCVDTPANCGVPNPSGGGATFTRRWLITMNPTITSGGTPTTVTGARRITVLVTLVHQVNQRPVSFQMSMVRP